MPYKADCAPLLKVDLSFLPQKIGFGISCKLSPNDLNTMLPNKISNPERSYSLYRDVTVILFITFVTESL